MSMRNEFKAREAIFQAHPATPLLNKNDSDPSMDGERFNALYEEAAAATLDPSPG